MTQRRITFALIGTTLLLGSGAMACAPRRTSTARSAVDRIQAELRNAAHDFTEGIMTGRAYRAFSLDRAGKARRISSDPAWREALTVGDADGDHVPDAYDRCRTPAGAPTDEHGCPLAPDACSSPHRNSSDPGCGPTADDDRSVRRILDELTVLINSKCERSPVPQATEPLEWGRWSTGFNLAVTKVANQAQECEFFYEIEVRYESLTNPNDVRYAHALFRATEDISPANSQRATFHLPMPENTVLSLGRHGLRELFKLASPIQWRVRAVNGSNATSAWSAAREQGPAWSGVHE